MAHDNVVDGSVSTTRIEHLRIDLGAVTSTEQLHLKLKDALGFPDWYGSNWDAFWDAITGLVEMPLHLNIRGWDALARRLPREAALLQKCLAQMTTEYPESAPRVTFD